MKALLTALTAVWLVLPASADEAKATDFIRVDEDSAAARLQTAVTRYEKGGRTVDLIGAVHIADAAYYKTLGEKFPGYDAVLFEMIGDGKAQAAKAGEKDEVGGLHQIYGMVAKFLNLKGQKESVDYTQKNFVHADISLEDFKKLQTEKGESVLGFAAKASEGQAANGPDTTKLMQAMLSGNSNGMKLEIIHTLGGGDDQVAAFAGDSVIIGDRNAKCLEVMDKELKGGHKKLAIFYGAAHFPDMEKRLLEKGFKKTKHDWLTAWNVPKPQPKAAPVPPAAPAIPASPADPAKKAA